MEIVIPTAENPCLECNDWYMNKCVKSSYCMKYGCYQAIENYIQKIRNANIEYTFVRVKDGNGN